MIERSEGFSPARVVIFIYLLDFFSADMSLCRRIDVYDVMASHRRQCDGLSPSFTAWFNPVISDISVGAGED